MKKITVIIFLGVFLFSGCAGGTQDVTDSGEVGAAETAAVEAVGSEIPEDMLSTINDWILGTDYGIERIDFDGDVFTVYLPERKQAALADYARADINTALFDIGAMFGYKNCQTVFADGSPIAASPSERTAPADEATADSGEKPASSDTINLIFIHHSVGENWLNDGLCQALNESNIHVADTYYGWSDMGDMTDTKDWPRWFNDAVMPSVYSKLTTETANNTIPPGSGENTIVMFKSCFPNSNVGASINDEIAIYNSLLDYFSLHTDKMFVLVTPPPMRHITTPKKTRALANFLVDADGWLKDYPHHNVYVFDLYNVLTSPDNHHMLVDGAETHIVASGQNTLYYDSDGDDHPNMQGNIKATTEFVPLLLDWYRQFIK